MAAGTVIEHAPSSSGTRRTRWSPRPSPTSAGSATATLQPNVTLAPAASIRQRSKAARAASKIWPGIRSAPTTPGRSRTATQEYSIWPPTAVPSNLDHQRCHAPRARAEVPHQRRWVHHRHPLLQGQREYRCAHWQPVDAGGHVDEHRDLHQRNRVGLAAGDASRSGRGDGEHDLCGVVPQPARDLLGNERRPLRAPASINGPLEALSNSAAGGNGVYRYGTTGFPTETFNSANYWVDVVFDTSIGPDTTAPTVTGRTPAPGATGVAASTAMTATFNEDLNAATVSSATVELRNSLNALVAATVSYASGTRTATLLPTSALAAVRDLHRARAGRRDGRQGSGRQRVGGDITWTFTTAGADTTPPTVVSTTPANGSSAASRSLPLTATFSEPLAASTVTTATFELRDATNALVAATVSYVAGSGSATLQPSAILAPRRPTRQPQGRPDRRQRPVGESAQRRLQLVVHHRAQEYSIWPADRRADHCEHQRCHAARARVEVPHQRRWLHHRHPLLQGQREYRSAHGHPVDARRARCSAP